MTCPTCHGSRFITDMAVTYEHFPCPDCGPETPTPEAAMRSNFGEALALVLHHEGGFVNDPRDPGGATNKGVTQETYDLWRVDHQLPIRSVELIAPAEVCAIYKHRYWDKVAGDQLPPGVDYCVFDFAVNSGPSRAAKYLQRALGVAEDRKIGPVTLEAAERVPARDLIHAISNLRQGFLERQPHFPTFGRGWTRRVAEVEVAAKELAK
jgi:lysozyme family protein